MNPDSLIGERVAGYRVAARVREEMLGHVYTAVAEDGTRVDLKVLLPELLHDAEAMGRFGREMLATGAVKHAGTVRLLDFGEEGDLHYLVLEHAPGGRLSTALAEQTLGVDRSVWIAAQIAAALHAAHAVGVVHRNLVPSNILLLENADGDYVKIRDFGLSWLEDYRATDDGRLTQIESPVGSHTYMAPEYIESQRFDARSDLYALGCLLFEMLTGDPPFLGNAGQVLNAHTRQPAPRASSKTEVPAWLDDVVAALLSKDPEARPRNGEAVVKLLEEGSGRDLAPPALREAPPPQDSGSTWATAAPPPPRQTVPTGPGNDPRKAIAGLLGVFFLCLLLALAWVFTAT